MSGHIIDFIDTETTGLPDKHPNYEIVEIAVVRWQDGERTERLHEYIWPKDGMPAETAAWNPTYYSDAEWQERGAQPWDVECSEAIASLLDGCFIGGSNPDFDMKLIALECSRLNMPRPNWSHRTLNTSSLGYPLWVYEMISRTGLVELASYFGVRHDAHTAIGDCHAAIGVWESFCDMYVYRPRMMREALQEIEAGAYSRFGAKGINEIIELAGRGLRGE